MEIALELQAAYSRYIFLGTWPQTTTTRLHPFQSHKLAFKETWLPDIASRWDERNVNNL